MRLTNAMVKWFEDEQREYGTKTALSNLLWTVAASLFEGLGITRIRTTYGREKKRRAA